MRRGPSLKRKPEPDPIYNSLLVSQLINQVLLDGKKDLASNIVYSALELVEKQTGSDPINTLKDAFENVRPQIETKSRRVGGTNYQVPMEVPQRRSTTLAIRWMVDSSRKRGENTMSERLGREILDASLLINLLVDSKGKIILNQALDLEDAEVGLNCLAIPLYHEGKIDAVLGVAGPAARIPASQLRAFASKLQRVSL